MVPGDETARQGDFTEPPSDGGELFIEGRWSRGGFVPAYRPHGRLLSPLLISVQVGTSEEVDLLAATASTFARAEIQEVSGLVPDQAEPCLCDALVGAVGDSLLSLLYEPLDHLSNGQGVDCFSSV